MRAAVEAVVMLDEAAFVVEEHKHRKVVLAFVAMEAPFVQRDMNVDCPQVIRSLLWQVPEGYRSSRCV